MKSTGFFTQIYNKFKITSTSNLKLQEIEAEGTDDVSECLVGEIASSEPTVVSCTTSSDVGEGPVTENGQRPTTPRTQSVNKVKSTPKETTTTATTLAEKDKIEDFGLHRSIK